jgi:hypothetical protein
MTKKVVWESAFQYNNDIDLLIGTPVLTKNNDFSVSASFSAKFIPYRLDIDVYDEPGDILEIPPYTITAYLRCNKITLHTLSIQDFAYDSYQGSPLIFTSNTDPPDTNPVSGTVTIQPLQVPPTYVTTSVTYGTLVILVKQDRSRFSKANAFQFGSVNASSST